MSQKKVLLVDDDLDEVELFRDLLDEIDPSIVYHYAMNGSDALQQLTSNAIGVPDIIFLDINMPVMNGWECLKRLKRMPALKDVPVVMYSTTDRDIDLQLARQLGAANFVTKHDNYTRFRKEIEHVLMIMKTLKKNVLPLPGSLTVQTFSWWRLIISALR